MSDHQFPNERRYTGIGWLGFGIVTALLLPFVIPWDDSLFVNPLELSWKGVYNSTFYAYLLFSGIAKILRIKHRFSLTILILSFSTFLTSLIAANMHAKMPMEIQALTLGDNIVGLMVVFWIYGWLTVDILDLRNYKPRKRKSPAE